MSAVGRNDACPCGSGQKHKKCCLIDKPSVMARTLKLSITINTDEDPEVVARRVSGALRVRALSMVTSTSLVEGEAAAAYWATTAAKIQQGYPHGTQNTETLFDGRTVFVEAFLLTTASAIDLGRMGNDAGRGPLRRMALCGVASVPDVEADALWAALQERQSAGRATGQEELS